MSKQYDSFKAKTIKAAQTINDAVLLKAVSEEYSKGFADAMWEAREIFMRVEDEPNEA